MALTFFDTLRNQPVEFTPIVPGNASLYTCGPTVYNFAHVGNFRAYVFEDVLRRVLSFCGFQVKQVMNLTDVDDKTIRGANEKKIALDAFTRPFKDAFFADLKTLRIQPAEVYPEATAHVPQMIALIETLVAKGFAYVGEDGSVYYAIDKFPGYGKLAHIDLAGQRSGVRIKNDEYAKDSAADFALWKKWDAADGEVAWDSPWGRGRPGWHIECSAMSKAHLGAHFDIHTGGVDNKFPHHEDEIAQSEAANGETFVNYWLHCEHLSVDGEKMAKSKGNFYTLRDILNKGYDGREIRYLLLAAHYRAKLNFTFEGLDATRVTLRRIDEFTRRLREAAGAPAVGADAATTLCAAADARFRAAVEDDLNTPLALAALFDFIRDFNRALDTKEVGGAAVAAAQAMLQRWDTVLAVLEAPAAAAAEVPADIQAKAAARLAAKKARDFATADTLRKELLASGWKLIDTPQGQRVERA